MCRRFYCICVLCLTVITQYQNCKQNGRKINNGLDPWDILGVWWYFWQRESILRKFSFTSKCEGDSALDERLSRPVELKSQHRPNKPHKSIFPFYPATSTEIQPGGSRPTVSGVTLKAIFIRLKIPHAAMKYGIISVLQRHYALWYYCEAILSK